MSLSAFRIEPYLAELVEQCRRARSPVRAFQVTLNQQTLQFGVSGLTWWARKGWEADYGECLEAARTDQACFMFVRLDTMNNYDFYDWVMIIYLPCSDLATSYQKSLVAMNKTSMIRFFSPHLQFIYRAYSPDDLCLFSFSPFVLRQQLRLFKSGYGDFRPGLDAFNPKIYDHLPRLMDRRRYGARVMTIKKWNRRIAFRELTTQCPVDEFYKFGAV